VNGTYVGTGTVGDNDRPTTPFNAFRIGMDSHVDNSYYRGAVDEVLFWPSVKDASFVTNLYEAYNGRLFP
jgi:hypothetical protein